MRTENLSFIRRYVLEGGIIVYPTDTLYALGAYVYNKDAVGRVFEIKRRPFSDPLPVAVSSKEEIEEIAFVNDLAKVIINAFLPGPLTIILKKKNIPDIVTAGLPNVALRIPNNKKAIQLLSRTGPLTATSANIHGMNVPESIEEIEKQLKMEIIAIDDGTLEGKPSTIVDLTKRKPRILREGAISKEKIMDVVEGG